MFYCITYALCNIPFVIGAVARVFILLTTSSLVQKYVIRVGKAYTPKGVNFANSIQ